MKPDFYCRFAVPYHVVKKNNRPIVGRGIKKWIGKSERLINAEKYLTQVFTGLKQGMGITEPLKGDLHLILRFYHSSYFTAKGERSRTMADLSNLIEAPQDCLQMAGIIANDTDVVCLDGTTRLPGKTDELEVEIYVLHDSVYQRRTKEFWIGVGT